MSVLSILIGSLNLFGSSDNSPQIDLYGPRNVLAGHRNLYPSVIWLTLWSYACVRILITPVRCGPGRAASHWHVSMPRKSLASVPQAKMLASVELRYVVGGAAIKR